MLAEIHVFIYVLVSSWSGKPQRALKLISRDPPAFLFRPMGLLLREIQILKASGFNTSTSTRPRTRD